MILKHNCSSTRKQQKFLYMSHSINSYLVSLNNEFYEPHSSILLNQKSIPGDMTIFASRCDKQHLSSRNCTGSIQSAENLPNVSHTKNLKYLCSCDELDRKQCATFTFHAWVRSDIHYNKYYLNSWQKDRLQNSCNMPQNVLKFISIHHLAFSGSSEVLNKNGS